MTTALLRWLLDPRSSWLAWRLVRQAPEMIDFDIAWRNARVWLHRDEDGFRARGHQLSPGSPGADGQRPRRADQG